MFFTRSLNLVLSFGFCIFPTVLAQVTAQDLPACAQKCFTTLPSNSFSPGCSLTPGSNFEDTFSPCFYTRCSTRVALSALNITSIICDEPVRDISQAIRIYVIIATVVASVVIGLRVLVKIKGLAGGIGLDDWAIVVSVGLTMIATVGQFLGGWYGLGRDEWKLDENAHRWVLKSFYVAAIGYKLANSGCRVSLLCFYLRIFGTSAFRRAVVALISLNVALGITFALADALQCRPPAAFWKDWTREQGSHCASLGAISWSHAILNIIMDIATLGMAVWMNHNCFHCPGPVSDPVIPSPQLDLEFGAGLVLVWDRDAGRFGLRMLTSDEGLEPGFLWREKEWEPEYIHRVSPSTLTRPTAATIHSSCDHSSHKQDFGGGFCAR
ncbi:hypothetical protein B0J13DRAFT_612093 [Dactylonectria estremocensis]|uniref:Rhodopsin domain-containing protein n=1 Tax=Dactylonectria estremocensis TaxID=1079267 RepID=A0A9P9IJZ2_9HYPO|nr:hypothetical protein B0J13DRAFT_612093 [Dactylonectria estremocensis]